MPRAHALLHWSFSGGVTSTSSCLEPPPVSPATSAAQPPLSVRTAPFSGSQRLAPPRRRAGGPATGVAAPPRQARTREAIGIVESTARAGAPVTGAVTPTRRALKTSAKKHVLGKSLAHAGRSAAEGESVNSKTGWRPKVAGAAAVTPRPPSPRKRGSHYHTAGVFPVSVTEAAQCGTRET